MRGEKALGDLKFKKLSLQSQRKEKGRVYELFRLLITKIGCDFITSLVTVSTR